MKKVLVLIGCSALLTACVDSPGPSYSPFQLSDALSSYGIPCETVDGGTFSTAIGYGEQYSTALCHHPSLGEGVYYVAVFSTKSSKEQMIVSEVCGQYMPDRTDKEFVEGENWVIVPYIQSVFTVEDFSSATKGTISSVGSACR